MRSSEFARFDLCGSPDAIAISDGSGGRVQLIEPVAAVRVTECPQKVVEQE
jgi:hypothetical protein